MGRRKKEPPCVHREAIAAAAERLFAERGIVGVSMDDIAAAAGYSKATLYVYFQNKEEIVGILTLKSMQMLQDYLCQSLDERLTTKERYDKICQSLLRYQSEYPFFFDTVLKSINLDFESSKCVPEDKETFLVGERINEQFQMFFLDGIKRGELRPELALPSTPFSLWGMLSGLILLATNKEIYIRQVLKLEKEEFLQQGFDTLYHSIENR